MAYGFVAPPPTPLDRRGVRVDREWLEVSYAYYSSTIDCLIKMYVSLNFKSLE
jgi:hypothetical protein